MEFRLISSAAHSESIDKAGVKRKCNMFFASALQVKNKKAMDLTEKLNESAHNKFQKPLVHEEESIVKKRDFDILLENLFMKSIGSQVVLIIC